MTRMRAWRWRSIAAGAVVAAGVGAIAALILLRAPAVSSEDNAPAAKARPQSSAQPAAKQGEAATLRLDAATQQRIGIETAPLRAAPRREELRAYGRVLDLTPLTELAARYANARAQLEGARARLEGSRSAYDRSRSLYKDQQNVSAAQLQSAEATFRSDQAAVAAADAQLTGAAAAARQDWGPTLGQSLVDGSALAARLTGREDVLIQVTLSAHSILPTAPTEASVDLPGGKRVPLRYVSPATRTDPLVQGPSFLYVAAADSGLLPGMNVPALLPSERTREGVLVPDTAVLRWEGADWVYLRMTGDNFVRRRIDTTVPALGGYVVADLPLDAAIVTHGAELLLSEEFKTEIRGGEND
jgi:hypothetical protein